jgi:hypothetical protein
MKDERCKLNFCILSVKKCNAKRTTVSKKKKKKKIFPLIYPFSNLSQKFSRSLTLCGASSSGRCEMKNFIY